MRKIVIALTAFLLSYTSFSQDTSADSLLMDLGEETKPQLLPEKMLITQRAFWGENGLYRKLHIAPMLTPENRQKEMKIRRNMFKIHQAVGLLTAASMIAQGFLGSRIYSYDPDSGKDYPLQAYNAHKANALGLNIGYATTALMAFTAPPPLVNRKGFNNIKLHKILSYVHLTGMITTNVLSKQIGKNPDLKPYHRAAAFTTFGAYLVSMASLKFEF